MLNTPCQEWAQLQGQAERVASWPSHPLEPTERLALAEAFVLQSTGVVNVGELPWKSRRVQENIISKGYGGLMTRNSSTGQPRWNSPTSASACG